MIVHIFYYNYSGNYRNSCTLIGREWRQFFYSAIITSTEVIIARGQIFKIAASRFVNVSEEEINLMKENAIPRNTKHATKFGMTLFENCAKRN